MKTPDKNQATHYDYLIIGVGPAGLQMGYFLGQAKRHYLILEAEPGPGSFYAEHPRHRTLLSINKPYNLYPEADFNLRHDWNSLLCDDEVMLFKHYSEELYPAADELYRYLQDFACHYNLNIQYNTQVSSVHKDEASRFVLTDREGSVYTGQRLLMATGAVKPNIPEHIEGIEHALGYEDHPLDRAMYKNKKVGIIGRGNAAFEVANHLAGSAGVLHMLLGGKNVKHAWQTHFVGDLRAINNTVLDMYQLKSLHTTLGFNLLKIDKNPDGTLVATVEVQHPHWDPPCTLRIQVHYDYMIRCTGWKYVTTDLFVPDCTPAVDAKSKYPALSAAWESTVPDLFYMGAAMAGRDRQAASGFIHGFRYNIRTLFHLLEERYHGVPLPSQEFSYENEDDLKQLAHFLVKRISITSALYQLFGFLCDVMVFTPGKVTYYYELPVAWVHEREDIISNEHVLINTLEYGFHNYDSRLQSGNFIYAADPNKLECSAFLHPIFRSYSKGKLIEEMYGSESLMVRYDQPEDELFERHREIHREGIDNFMMNILNRVLKITDKVYDTEVFPQELIAQAYFPWSEEQIQALRDQEANQKLLQEDAKCRYVS